MIKIFSIISLILVGIIFLYVAEDMPDFGKPENPTNLHVSPRYIEKSMEETGSPNIVTAVLASYRGYDTLGETTVIFTAGMAAILLFQRWENEREKK
jgi:multicomponent Na+:H+ antiporter subunit B